ncbi:MFS transporter [Bacillus massiliigorillae]|uniref:MFS transporter n=1 Tax=Bacillus massiliigorillae TaxID=1243664 RepID=UPI00039F3A39|nr:MFS transporter [Bacillus massiliigorillae]
MRSKFAALGCYINYFAFGMAYIMIAQNMSFLSEKLNTDNAGVSFLISAFGVGRLLSLYIAGTLSDRIGRKPFVILGALFCALFLVGIPLSPSYEVALIFAVLGGLSNAFLDAGTYPTLMESFPKYAGAATVSLKAFISVGSLILPFMIAFFLNNNIFFGWSFFVPAIILIISAVSLMTVKFPSFRVSNDEKKNEIVSSTIVGKPKFKLEGMALVGIGFTAPALLYLMQIWMPTYAQEVIGMSLTSSLKLISYYNVGAFVSVIAVAIALRKWVKAVEVLLVYPIITLVATLVLMFIQVPSVTVVAAFIIGFSLAGVMQLALSVMCEMFWKNKGRMTGILCTATSAATAGIPFVTGLITRFTDVSGVFIFSLMINITGILLAVLVNYRYRMLTKKTANVQQMAA